MLAGTNKLGAVFMAVATLLSISACGASKDDKVGQPDAAGLVHIRVAGFEGITSATPLFVAQQQGYFKEADLDVTYITMSSGATAMAAALRAGEIDVGLGGASQWITDTARGAIKGKLIGELTDNIYVIAAGKGITDPRQLKGKIFAVSNRNGGDALYSQAALAKLGVAVGDIVWMQMGDPAARLGALIAGKVDATEVSLTSLPPRLKSQILVSIEQSPVTFVSSAIYARQPLLDANKSALTKFLAAMGKGADWARAHPAEAIPACLESGGSKEVCETTIKVASQSTNPYTWSSTSRLNVPGIEGMLPIIGAVVPQVKSMKIADITDSSVAPAAK
jgi:NitT/TauT family transport system substrate-binding protein